MNDRRKDDWRLEALLSANDEMLRVVNEHVRKDDIIQDNFVKFQNKFGAYLDISLQRELERAMIRKAILDKLIAAGVWSFVVGLFTLIGLGIKQWINVIK